MSVAPISSSQSDPSTATSAPQATPDPIGFTSVPQAVASKPSSYQTEYDSLVTYDNQALLAYSFGSSDALNQPVYKFGSDALIMATLGNTISVLHQAYNSGLYGTGTGIDTLA